MQNFTAFLVAEKSAMSKKRRYELCMPSTAEEMVKKKHDLLIQLQSCKERRRNILYKGCYYISS